MIEVLAVEARLGDAKMSGDERRSRFKPLILIDLTRGMEPAANSSSIYQWLSSNLEAVLTLSPFEVRNTMALENVPCPICKTWERSKWGTENGFTAVQCLSCRLVYVSPRPDEATITSSNKIGEHRHDSGSLNVVYTRSRRQFRRFRSNFQSLLQPEIRDGRPISWIDIGAGFGEAIEALQQILPAGSDVVGIEPMEPKVADAVRRGLPIRVATLDDISQQYDGATLINVFSHVPSPDSFMREVTRVIKPNGLLLLETGNAGDLNSAEEYPDELLLPDHLVFAGVDNMRELLTRNGFVVERILEQRLDTAAWVARKAIKKLIGRNAKLAVPYRSKFRSVFYRARLVSGNRS